MAGVGADFSPVRLTPIPSPGFCGRRKADFGGGLTPVRGVLAEPFGEFARMSRENATATFAVALNAEAGSLPSRIVLLPAGRTKGRDGREFVNDDPDAVIALFNERGIELPIDVEHATEIKAPKGEAAPAFGWMKKLVNDAGALCADVEWTEDGKKLIGSKAYRYLSPAFMHSAAGQVRRLLSAGLTNKPNLFIPALNSENAVKLTAIAAALGMKEDATETDLVTAINTMRGENTNLKSSVDKPDPNKFVPKADLDAALQRAVNAETKLNENDKKSNEQKITALLDGAVKDGKIAPSSKDHYRALCNEAGGLEKVEKLIGTLPKLTPEMLEKETVETKAGELTAEQKALCRQTGVSEEDFKKSLATETAAAA